MLYLGRGRMKNRLMLLEERYVQNMLDTLEQYNGEGIRDESEDIRGTVGKVSEKMGKQIKKMLPGLRGEDDKLIVGMNSQTAPLWTTLIAICLRTLKDIYSSSGPPKVEDLLLAHNMLSILRWTLRQDAVKSLFTIRELSDKFKIQTKTNSKAHCEWC
jgi:hypothetical protein